MQIDPKFLALNTLDFLQEAVALLASAKNPAFAPLIAQGSQVLHQNLQAAVNAGHVPAPAAATLSLVAPPSPVPAAL